MLKATGSSYMLRRKRRRRWQLPLILMLVGFSVMAYPTASRAYFDYQQSKVLSGWEEMMEDNAVPTGDTASIGSTTIPEEPVPLGVTTPSATTAELTNEEQKQQEAADKKTKTRELLIKEHALGVLVIEQIEMKLPVLDDATKYNLSIAPSKVKGTGDPDAVGNFSIAGHRSKAWGRNFNRLDELNVGSVAEFQLPDKTLRYQVTEKNYVDPSAVEVLAGHGFKEMTLITCHPMDKPTCRLIVTLQQIE